jgi:hypothetical protein
MISLPFYSMGEKKPANGENIMFVHGNDFYMHYEMRHGTVNYTWDSLDEDGEYDGTTIMYDERIPQPENTELVISVDGNVLDKSVLWAPMDPFWKQVEQRLEGKKDDNGK